MKQKKKQLRKTILERRDKLTAEQVEAFSQRIAEKLFALPEYRHARTVMYFISFGKEPETLKMVPQSIAHGKRIVAPKTVPSTKQLLLSEIRDIEADLAPGLWDIPEPRAEAMRPAEASEIDFVVVPGVAFDEKGNRLGYGAGYYDRFIPRLNSGVPLVALAFELQVVESVPVEPWDVKVDVVVTEERVIYCS